jgi:hypothetical protein
LRQFFQALPHEDEVVYGAPEIIWRRIGTHGVVSD